MRAFLKYFALFSLLSIAQCSPELRYRILSTAFDGVPQPSKGEIVTVDSTGFSEPDPSETGALDTVPTSFRHEVYRRRTCDSCHDADRGNKLIEPQPTLCYNCHDDFESRYEVVHGPVASGFCTGCHSPHLAPFESLLIRDGRGLCLNCHLEKDVMRNDVHDGEEETSCVDCHSPHGGDDRFLF